MPMTVGESVLTALFVMAVVFFVLVVLLVLIRVFMGVVAALGPGGAKAEEACGNGKGAGARVS